MYFVTILDIVVAGAWNTLFEPINRKVSFIAASTRVVFAIGFMVAIRQLVIAFTRVTDPDAPVGAANAFTTIWVVMLGIFGIHLLLIRARRLPERESHQPTR